MPGCRSKRVQVSSVVRSERAILSREHYLPSPPLPSLPSARIEPCPGKTLATTESGKAGSLARKPCSQIVMNNLVISHK